MNGIDNLAEVVMVEDNPMDIMLTEKILKNYGISVHFTIFRDGEEFVGYISRNSPANNKYPDLVLLDLNLPRMNGFEVLRFIKEDDNFQGIPVIIVSGSTAQEDIEATINLGAELYLGKPFGVDSLELITQKVLNLQITEHEGWRYLTVNNPTTLERKHLIAGINGDGFGAESDPAAIPHRYSG